MTALCRPLPPHPRHRGREERNRCHDGVAHGASLAAFIAAMRVERRDSLSGTMPMVGNFPGEKRGIGLDEFVTLAKGEQQIRDLAL